MRKFLNRFRRLGTLRVRARDGDIIDAKVLEMTDRCYKIGYWHYRYYLIFSSFNGWYYEMQWISKTNRNIVDVSLRTA